MLKPGVVYKPDVLYCYEWVILFLLTFRVPEEHICYPLRLPVVGDSNIRKPCFNGGVFR
jgi:hypothetical protein